MNEGSGIQHDVLRPLSVRGRDGGHPCEIRPRSDRSILLGFRQREHQVRWKFWFEVHYRSVPPVRAIRRMILVVAVYVILVIPV